MSQAGIVDFEGSHPQVPTSFVTNVGTAVPIANTLEILGTIVAAHSIPLQTTGSGNTVTIQAQYASAAASSSATNAGMASFSSTYFSVDANGFVTLNGSEIGETITGNVGGALSPVSGNWNIFGSAVAAGITPVQTSGSGNTLTVQVQRAQAITSTNASEVGLAAFNSTYFIVDTNGFVSLNGATVGETITGNTGGALSPTAGNWNILGTSTAAGAIPVQTSGSGSTLTVQVQKSQAIASTNAANVGLAAFNSTYFTVDANGFVSLNGSSVAETITGNTGGALSPTSGNWNILGSGSLTTSGSGSTLTVELTGITNHAVQIGSSGTTLTQVGPSATTGAVLASNGAAADPSFQTIASLGGITSITGNSGGAEVPSAGNFNILGTGSITVAGSANTETVQLTGLTNHNVLVGAGTSTITSVAPSATAGVPLISNGAAADPSFGTAVVGGGGTGATSFTAYSVICAGTTSTAAFQNVSGIGTSGQVLTSNGSSALPTWQNASTGNAFTTITVQIFTSSGTYTPTSGMKYCTIECVGGGGGGGGTNTTGSTGSSVGGGGGGAGYARKTVSSSIIGASQTVTVGSGGNAGSTGGGNGGSGNSSSVGSICIAGGGSGGAGGGNNSITASNYVSGGAGGAGSVGDILAGGGIGGTAMGAISTGVAASGVGGNSIFGGGGEAQFTTSSASGNPGVNYGGGGSGGATGPNNSGVTGGAGASGIVVITEFS